MADVDSYYIMWYMIVPWSFTVVNYAIMTQFHRIASYILNKTSEDIDL